MPIMVRIAIVPVIAHERCNLLRRSTRPGVCHIRMRFEVEMDGGANDLQHEVEREAKA
jgi:hypothetical protein